MEQSQPIEQVCKQKQELMPTPILKGMHHKESEQMINTQITDHSIENNDQMVTPTSKQQIQNNDLADSVGSNADQYNLMFYYNNISQATKNANPMVKQYEQDNYSNYHQYRSQVAMQLPDQQIINSPQKYLGSIKRSQHEINVINTLKNKFQSPGKDGINREEISNKAFGDNQLTNYDQPYSFDDFGFDSQNYTSKRNSVENTQIPPVVFPNSIEERTNLAERIQKKLNIVNEGYRQDIQIFEHSQKQKALKAVKQTRQANLKLGENIRMNIGMYASLDINNKLMQYNEPDNQRGVIDQHKLADLDFTQREVNVPFEKMNQEVYPKDQRKLMLLQHKEIITSEQMQNAQYMQLMQSQSSGTERTQMGEISLQASHAHLNNQRTSGNNRNNMQEKRLNQIKRRMTSNVSNDSFQQISGVNTSILTSAKTSIENIESYNAYINKKVHTNVESDRDQLLQKRVVTQNKEGLRYEVNGTTQLHDVSYTDVEIHGQNKNPSTIFQSIDTSAGRQYETHNKVDSPGQKQAVFQRKNKMLNDFSSQPDMKHFNKLNLQKGLRDANNTGGYNFSSARNNFAPQLNYQSMQLPLELSNSNQNNSFQMSNREAQNFIQNKLLEQSSDPMLQQSINNSLESTQYQEGNQSGNNQTPNNLKRNFKKFINVDKTLDQVFKYNKNHVNVYDKHDSKDGKRKNLMDEFHNINFSNERIKNSVDKLVGQKTPNQPQNPSMLKQLYFSQTVHLANSPSKNILLDTESSKLSLRNLNPNQMIDKRHQIEKIINSKKVMKADSFKNDFKKHVKSSRKDIGQIAMNTSRTVNNEQLLCSMSTPRTVINIQDKGESLTGSDSIGLSLPQINNSASKREHIKERTSTQVEKYDPRYQLTDEKRIPDKNEIDKLIFKPKLSLDQTRFFIKGKFKESRSKGGMKSQRNQSQYIDGNILENHAKYSQYIATTPSEQQKRVVSLDNSQVSIVSCGEDQGKKVKFKDRNFQQDAEKKMDYISSKLFAEADKEIEIWAKEREEAAAKLMFTPKSNAQNVTPIKEQTVKCQEKKNKKVGKRVQVLNRAVKIDLDKYLEGSKALPNRVSSNPYAKYQNFKFFPSGTPTIEERFIISQMSSMSKQDSVVLSEKSEDWLSLNFGQKEQSEQCLSNVDLRRQDSQTYQRLFTPPEKDSEAAIALAKIMTEVKNLSGATLLKMITIKQSQIDAQTNDIEDEFRVTKQFNHLRPQELEIIQENYLPILEQISCKLRSDHQHGEEEYKTFQTGTSNINQSYLAHDRAAILDKTVTRFVEGIRRRQEFYSISKHAANPLLRNKQQVDPQIKFQEICRKQNAVAIPILTKIENKVLDLSGYKMNLGNSIALGNAFMLFNDVVEKLLFENINMDDQMFSAILNGLMEQDNFKSVTYKQNSFENVQDPVSHLSIKALIKLAKRTVPQNLDEIRIINCKISPTAVLLLLQELKGSKIRRLSLINAHIGTVLIDPLIECIQKSYNLIKLDISWNKLTPEDMKKLFRVLSTNRQLHSLNLSWNHIQDSEKSNNQDVIEWVAKKEVYLNQIEDAKDAFEVGKQDQQDEIYAKDKEKLEKKYKKEIAEHIADFMKNFKKDDQNAEKVPMTPQEALEELLKNKKIALEEAKHVEQKVKDIPEEKALNDLQDKYNKMIEDEKVLDDDEEEILENLGKFIKYNKKLLQIDLSYTGLRENLLRELISCLSKTKSLLIFDVSGNLNCQRRPRQLLTMKVREHVLNAHTGMPVNKEINHRDELLTQLSARIHCKPNPFDFERLNYVWTYFNDLDLRNKLFATKKEKILESMETKNIRESLNVKFTHRMNQLKNFQNSETLIYQRILGHKYDMPGSGQWVETSADTTPAELLNDWITEKSQYTLVFWSKNFAKQVQLNGEMDQLQIAEISKLLQQPNYSKVKENHENLRNINGPMPYMFQNEVKEEKRSYLQPPLLAGSMNNWQYSQMFKIQDLIAILNPDHEDVIQSLFNQGKIDAHCKTPQQIRNTQVFEMYLRKRLRQEHDYTCDWIELLLKKCLRYSDPCLINMNQFQNYPKFHKRYNENFMVKLLMKEITSDTDRRYASSEHYPHFKEMLNEELHSEDQLWVAIAMSRPGRHQYIVKYQDHRQLMIDEQILKEKQQIAEKAAKRAAKLIKMQETYKDNDEMNKVMPHVQLGMMTKLTEMLDISIAKDLGVEPETPFMTDQQRLSSMIKRSSTSSASPSRLTLMKEKLTSQEDGDDKYTRFSFHRCVIQAREEEIPVFAKQPQSHVHQRTFSKNLAPSVFADWREDSKKNLETAFNLDKEQWKLQKFIKDPYDLEMCKMVILDNFAQIREIYALLASKSHQWYPTIGWITYSDFCQSCKLDIPLATIDRIFIATNVEMNSQEENPSQALNRYEFLEVIARLSKDIYKDRGQCTTVYESITKLLEEHIFKFGYFDQWQEFRDKKLWTLEVNDVYVANLDLLKAVYKKYQTQMRFHWNLDDAIKFMCHDSNLKMNEKDAIYCYGISKMTVLNEQEHFKQYQRMTFVEFLEMIGRIAELRFRTTPMNTIPLSQKVEFVLDEVIPYMLKDKERQNPEIAEVEQSDSDEDY